MDPISTALIAKALDGLNQRSLFTAQNIANANSSDYRPAHVTFEESLRTAASDGLGAINAVEPQTLIDEGAAPMRLDLELAAASQTAMRYRALIEILGRQMALDRAVLSAAGGRQ